MMESQFHSNEVSLTDDSYSTFISNDFPLIYPTASENSLEDFLDPFSNLESFYSIDHESEADHSIEEGIILDDIVDSPPKPVLQKFDNELKTERVVSTLPLLHPEYSSENTTINPPGTENISPSIDETRTKRPEDFVDTFTIPENHNYGPKTTDKIIQGVFPRLYQVSPQTYGLFLSDNLRNWSHFISLEEFYILLYNPRQSGLGKSPKDLNVVGILNLGSLGSKEYGFEVCSFILETFRVSCHGARSEISSFQKNKSFSSMNYEEILRTFLALKFIFDSIEEVDQSSIPYNTLPRKSLYDEYCKTCQNLGKIFQTDGSKLYKFNPSSIVGVPHFGRLTRLVYPNLKLRRLGRRGNSRYHYSGITWSKRFTRSEDMKKVGNVVKKPDTFQENGLKETAQTLPIFNPDLPSEIKDNMSQFPCKKAYSSYSYIRSSSKFPEIPCSPRNWECVPGMIPEQSSWSRNTISRSVIALRKYHVNMQPIIQSLHYQLFLPQGVDLFLPSFVRRMNILINGNSDEKGYMHLYLIFLLLLFPVILTSDDEVPIEEKEKVRKNLTIFSDHLSPTVPNLPNREKGHLINFSNIVRKMIHINEITVSKIKKKLANEITHVIALDLQKKVICEFDPHEVTVAEDIILRAVIIASNAFPTAFSSDNFPKSQPGNKNFIVNIIKALVKYAVVGTECLLKMSKWNISQDSDCTTFDLPFQIFRNLTQLFHQICLSDPFVSKLPIQVINSIRLFIHKEMHSVSFGDFGKRDHELSKNTFKTWWVHSTLTQEYMQILSEIVAMGEQLSREKD